MNPLVSSTDWVFSVNVTYLACTVFSFLSFVLIICYLQVVCDSWNVFPYPSSSCFVWFHCFYGLQVAPFLLPGFILVHPATPFGLEANVGDTRLGWNHTSCWVHLLNCALNTCLCGVPISESHMCGITDPWERWWWELIVNHLKKRITCNQ